MVAGGWLVCEVVTRVSGAMPDARVLSSYFAREGTGLLGLYDKMVGGALSSGSVLALGIMPYLSARTFRALGGVLSPTVARLEHSAEGRRTLGQWTMRLTAGLSVIQAYGFARLTQTLPGAVAQPGMGYMLQTIVVLASTATFMGWLCAQATEDEGDIGQSAPGLLRDATPDMTRDVVKRVVTPLPSISGSHGRG